MTPIGRIEFDDPTFAAAGPPTTLDLRQRIDEIRNVINALNRKVALITGGTRGIGLGIARKLAQEGFTLAINGRRPSIDPGVMEVMEELLAYGGIVSYHCADISRTADQKRLLDEVKDFHGQLDVLVNNAGIAPDVRTDILHASEESYQRLIDTNLLGPHFLTKIFAQWLIDQKKLHPFRKQSIVFITSISATVASINRGEYCLSKAGLSMSAKLWAVRLAEYGIPVYEVRPGLIRTDMTESVKEKYDKLIAEGLTLDMRWGTPEDVGSAVAALVRGDIPYATGSIITLDGGLSIARL